MLWFSLSPWPSAMLIRHSFEQGGLQTNKILEKYAPEGITVTKDVHYDTSDAEALLDVYYPKADTKPLGTIFGCTVVAG